MRGVEGTSIRVHLVELNKVMMHLKNINEVLPDEKQDMMLLVSLADSFEHFTDSLLHGCTQLPWKR